ncbi:MAG: LPS assembly protein LptD [Candidatus Aminicenantes bacterium]|nr:LPS assembly protein LptD [Candidatus Aminicenantes bacterium]
MKKSWFFIYLFLLSLFLFSPWINHLFGCSFQINELTQLSFGLNQFDFPLKKTKLASFSLCFPVKTYFSLKTLSSGLAWDNSFSSIDKEIETKLSPKDFSETEDLPIILANKYERDKERIFASGEVEVRYRQIRLFADRVEVNTSTKDVLAEGNVVLQLPEETVTALRLQLNLDTLMGKLEEVSGQIQPSLFYQAASIERKSGELYHFSRSSLTTCTQPNPRWRFACNQANFKKNDYVEMWGALFSVKGIPVLYLPYFRYPLNRERSTGFLMPQIGYNAIKGFTLTQSFYWAIARNMDATFTLDYYSARGLGGGIEYRYLFQAGTGGEAKIYTFTFKREAETGLKPANAYIVRLNHNQPLPFGFNLVANIDYQTSFNFLKEFDNNYRTALITNRSSQVFISRSWSHYSFNLRASRFETYFAQIDRAIIRKSLPEISFSSFKTRLKRNWPLFFQYFLSFQSWEYGWDSEFEAGKHKRTNIFALSPILSLPITTIPWLAVNASLGTNLIYYTKSYAPNTRQIIDEPLLLKNLSFSLESTGPIFYRIFEGGGIFGSSRIKHLIEPYTRFSYESPTELSKRVITAAGYFVRSYQLSYGLTNRLILKQEGMVREVFTWGLGQTFYLAPNESPLSPFRTPLDEIPRFSDIGSYLRFYPLKKISLDFSANYNHYWQKLASWRLQANFNSPADFFFFNFSWFKSMNPWYRDVLWDRHQLGLTTKFQLPRPSLEALVDLSLNLVERRLLYAGLSAVYHYQCLDFRFDFRLFQFRDKPEIQFKFSLGLGHIGKTTDFLAGLEF